MKFISAMIVTFVIIKSTSSTILECKFQSITIPASSNNMPFKQNYACYTEYTLNITTTDETITSVVGEHAEGLDDSHVLDLYIIHPISMIKLPKNIQNFFPNLKILRIIDANLKTIDGSDLEPFKNLIYFRLSNTDVETLEDDTFNGNIHLEEIYIYDSRIEYVYPEAFKTVKQLDYIFFESSCTMLFFTPHIRSMQKFKEKVSSYCSPKDYIYCTFETKLSNHYTCISPRYLQFKNKPTIMGNHKEGKTNEDIEELDIQSSNLERLPNILAKVFANLKVLKIKGDISELNRKDFENFQSLEELHLPYSKIASLTSEIFEDTKNLRRIDFKRNNIVSIGIAAFWFLRNLTTLDLKENSRVDFRADSEEDMKDLIKELKMSGVAIHDSLQCFYKYGSFKFIENDAYMCQGINMQHSPSSNTSILDRVYYAFGNHLPEMKNENVEALKIENYKLKSFPEDLPKVLPNLKSIEITKSLMKELNKESFVNFAELIVIDLSFNSLQRIPDGIFLKNLNLIYVNFENNNLEYIPAEIFLNNHKMDIFEFSSNNCISTSGYRDDIEEFLNEINQECK